MSHLVETMAYVGDTPWHGLGEKVEEGISLDEFRASAGLDWTVSKRPVWYPDTSGLGTNRVFKDRFVLTRDSDDRAYTVVSGRYNPVQPKEIFDFFHSLIDKQGFKMHTAGSLAEGKKIWCLAETDGTHFVNGVDQVDGYLLLCTSYDLSMATMAQFTSVRVVCNNTLQQSLERGGGGRVTIPHFCKFDEQELKVQLGLGAEQWAIFTRNLDVLAKRELSEVEVREVLRHAFGIPEGLAEVECPSHESWKHVLKVQDMFTNNTFKGAELANGTAWGLLNCVTEYVDWEKRARNQSNRLNSAWFGEGAAIKERAMHSLLFLAK